MNDQKTSSSETLTRSLQEKQFQNIDLNALAQKVYQLMYRDLMIQQERSGNNRDRLRLGR